MSNKTDLRVIRTKKSVKDAFIELMKTTKYSKITINNIAQKAVINRNTFYLHYLDKDDLLDQLCTESLHHLKTGMETGSYLSDLDDFTYEVFYEIVKSVFDEISKDLEFYSVVFRDDDLSYISFKVVNVIKNHLSSAIDKFSLPYGGNASKKGNDIYIEYLSSGLFGVIKYWVLKDNRYDVEEVSEMVINLYSSDLLKLLK